MDYKDYNDYELLHYVSEGNEESNDILIKKYEPLVKSLASKMINWCQGTGIEIGDLIQEGLLGLTAAIETFTDTKNTAFATHAKVCVERKMIDLIKMSKALKHKVLNESISIDDEDSGLLSIIKDEYTNPEEIIESIDTEQYLVERIKNKLTEKEDQVFQLMLSQFSYTEIASILDCDVKSVDNTIQRIRNKVREEIKKNN